MHHRLINMLKLCMLGYSFKMITWKDFLVGCFLFHISIYNTPNESNYIYESLQYTNFLFVCHSCFTFPHFSPDFQVCTSYYGWR